MFKLFVYLLVFVKMNRTVESDALAWSLENKIKIKGSVNQVRKGEDLSIKCYDDKSNYPYREALFSWMDVQGHGAARNDMILHGDGILEVRNAQPGDTNTYTCSVYLPHGTIETYTRTVVVYMLADYYIQYPFIYYVSECNYQLDNLKLHEIHEYVCRDYETNCPFQAKLTCKKLAPVLSQAEKAKKVEKEAKSQLIIFIELYPLSMYKPPSCDIVCMKNGIVEHFKLLGGQMIDELLKLEKTNQKKIYGSIVFNKEGSERLKKIKTRCQTGYELYQDILCYPCFPGYFVKNYNNPEDEYDIDVISSKALCLPCPPNTWQDKFGSEDCTVCPVSTVGNINGSITKNSCIPTSWNSILLKIHWKYFLVFGVLAGIILGLLIIWTIMACVTGNCWRSRKYLPVSTNEQDQWIEIKPPETVIRWDQMTPNPSPVSETSKSQPPSEAASPVQPPQSTFQPAQQPSSNNLQFNLPTSVATSNNDNLMLPIPNTVPPPSLESQLLAPSVPRNFDRQDGTFPTAILENKTSFTNLYKQALTEGLREVRIHEPGSSQASSALSFPQTSARASRVNTDLFGDSNSVRQPDNSSNLPGVSDVQSPGGTLPNGGQGNNSWPSTSQNNRNADEQQLQQQLQQQQQILQQKLQQLEQAQQDLRSIAASSSVSQDSRVPSQSTQEVPLEQSTPIQHRVSSVSVRENRSHAPLLSKSLLATRNQARTDERSKRLQEAIENRSRPVNPDRNSYSWHDYENL